MTESVVIQRLKVIVICIFQQLRSLDNKSDLPKLFQCHGTGDELVRFEWGQKMNKTLSEHGVVSEFHKFDFYHEMNRKEIIMLKEWILKMVPETSAL